MHGQRLWASDLPVGLGRTRPRVVWWVPWPRGDGLRPILALLSTRQVVLGKSPRPSVGLFPGQHSQ